MEFTNDPIYIKYHDEEWGHTEPQRTRLLYVYAYGEYVVRLVLKTDA